MISLRGTPIRLVAVTVCLVGGVTLWLAALARDACAAGAEKPVELLRRPLKVTATPRASEGPDLYSLDVSVDDGVDRFRFTTNVRANTLARAIETQRALTRWTGSYLLARFERGGGNASRGSLDLVFRLRGGKLLYLGEVEADSYQGGTFKDTYDKFENNELTSTAGAPTFAILLEEKGGRLRANLERTWQENRASFRENEAEIRALLARKALLSGPRLIDFTESVLFNAVLAKYCRRQAELRELLQAAPAGLDREDLNLFNEIIAGVIPGELPETTVEVVGEQM